MFDTSILGAVTGGLLAFFSPCILPMVPFYLSYMAGIGMGALQDGEGEIPARVRRRAILASIGFSAGIVTVFVAFGVTASLIGQALREWFDILRWVAAGFILLMGLHFLGVIRIGLLYRQLRAEAGGKQASGVFGAYLVGLAFAFGWTPCVGPVLSAILFMAGAEETAAAGGQLLLAFGIGMTLPFIIGAIFLDRFMRAMKSFRKILPYMEKVMGVMLVLFAILIATERINMVANWMVQYWPQIG